MIKFKQKKCDIIIQKATELRDSLTYETNQEFLKRGDVVVDYLNAKLKDAVAKGNTHCVISELTMVAMLTKNIVYLQKMVINNGFNTLYHYLFTHMVIDVNIDKNQQITKSYYFLVIKIDFLIIIHYKYSK